jgi:Beta-lactamase
VQPTQELIERIVRINLPTASPFIGAAVGVASPSFGTQIQCIGSPPDQTGNKMLFTTDNPFEIASITKTFTAMAYEVLLQSGAIGPNDTLNRFLTGQIPTGFLNVPYSTLPTSPAASLRTMAALKAEGCPFPMRMALCHRRFRNPAFAH